MKFYRREGNLSKETVTKNIISFSHQKIPKNKTYHLLISEPPIYQHLDNIEDNKEKDSITNKTEAIHSIFLSNQLAGTEKSLPFAPQAVHLTPYHEHYAHSQNCHDH